MRMNEYVKSRGLTVRLLTQKMGVTRQCFSNYWKNTIPTAKTLQKVAQAMTELGAPTTVVDLVAAFYEKETKDGLFSVLRKDDGWLTWKK